MSNERASVNSRIQLSIAAAPATAIFLKQINLTAGLYLLAPTDDWAASSSELIYANSRNAHFTYTDSRIKPL
jgi:hypothetical protein